MRRLTDEEAALWARVVATVHPLQGETRSAGLGSPEREVSASPARRRAQQASPRRRAHIGPVATLDAGWDRRLSRGLVEPDVSVDLHGHNLATANRRLDQAIGAGARVVLLVTGKPPASGERPVARGAIRAAVNDWLAASPHAGAIAAVRGAHPRHGGAGALYVVLRRKRQRG